MLKRLRVFMGAWLSNHWLNLSLGLFCLTHISIALYMYSRNFSGLSAKNEDWGTFGDYFGGVVNPVLSFITLLYLIFSYNTNKKQLNDTIRQSQSDMKILISNRTIDQLHEVATRISEELNRSAQVLAIKNEFYRISDMQRTTSDPLMQEINQIFSRPDPPGTTYDRTYELFARLYLFLKQMGNIDPNSPLLIYHCLNDYAIATKLWVIQLIDSETFDFFQENAKKTFV